MTHDDRKNFDPTKYKVMPTALSTLVVMMRPGQSLVWPMNLAPNREKPSPMEAT